MIYAQCNRHRRQRDNLRMTWVTAAPRWTILWRIIFAIIILIFHYKFIKTRYLGTPSFHFSDEKFMFKWTWQVVFSAARNDSGVPKQLAALLKARDGLHSKVVTPESGKRETKNGEINAVISTWYMQFWMNSDKLWNHISYDKLQQSSIISSDTPFDLKAKHFTGKTAIPQKYFMNPQAAIYQRIYAPYSRLIIWLMEEISLHS